MAAAREVERGRLVAIAYLALRQLRDEDPAAEPEVFAECRHRLHRMARPDDYDDAGKPKPASKPSAERKPKRRRASHLSVIGGGV